MTMIFAAVVSMHLSMPPNGEPVEIRVANDNGEGSGRTAWDAREIKEMYYVGGDGGEIAVKQPGRDLTWRLDRLRVAVMAHWLRLLLSVLALAGLLAAGAGDAAAKAHHHDHCCPGMSSAMMTDDHHQPGDDRCALPECCVLGLCGAPSLPGSAQVAVPAGPVFTQIFLPLRDDSGAPSLPPSPDLRPPIA